MYGGLANYILDARKRSNMSQEQLGEAVGVSRDTIRRWERGKTAPNIEEIMKIEQATGVYHREAYVDTARKIKIPIISLHSAICAGGGNGLDFVEMETDSTTDVDRDIFSTIDESRMPFAVRIEGDSMEEMGILDGDTVIINPAEMPEDGECALVCYRGRWSVKGVLMNRDGTVTLKAGKPQYDMVVSRDETIDESWFRVIGRVVLSRSERRPKRF